MNKYFIEYPKNHIYVCFDGLDSFVNFKFKHNGNEYLFVEFVPNNFRLFNAVKRVRKLKDDNGALNSMLGMIIDKLNLEPNRDKKGEFKFTILPEKDRDLKLEKENYPRIHIFADDKYYDNKYSGKMMYNRLEKKLPVVCFEF